jgi:hypothetical protein
MTTEGKRPARRFRLAAKPMLVIAALAQSPTLAVCLLSVDRPTARFTLTLTVLAAIFMFGMLCFLSTIEVNAKGLTLNWINFLAWDQVERVTPSNWLGLRYLKARRRKRLWAWWFPLYLADEDGFRRAVIEMAPVGNPFRQFFEAEIDRNV